MDHELITGDFNGDGISDCYVRENTYGNTNSGHLLLGAKINPLSEIHCSQIIPGGLKPGDYDGDGKTELLAIGNLTSIFWGLNWNNDYFDGYPAHDDINNYNSNGSIIGDFNMDGKTDVIFMNAETGMWDIYCSYGKGFQLLNSETGWTNSGDNILTGDFNGDGLMDIIFKVDGYNGWQQLINVQYFNEVHFDDAFTTFDFGNVEKIFVGHFTGRGKSGIIVKTQGTSASLWDHCENMETASNLIVKITKSLGSEIHITYNSLTNYLLHENPGANSNCTAQYPLSGYTSPIQIVTKINESNGIGGLFNDIVYDYECGKTHREGKGFLGFEKFIVTNTKTKTKTIENYSFDEIIEGDHNYYYTALKSIEKYAMNTSYQYILIQETTNTYDKHIFEYNDKAFFPFIEEAVTNYYTIDATQYKCSKNITLYDNHGNLTHMETHNGINESSLPYTEVTDNIYTDDLTNWFLGRLTKSTVVSQIPDKPAITRVSAFEYDPGDGLLTKEIIEPSIDGTSQISSKTYKHDEFGNITSTTFSAEGLPDLITNTYYDTDLPPDQRKGRFLTQTVNAYGHTENKIFDQNWGNVLEVESPNGLITTFEYDDFGRLYKTILPNGIQSKTLMRWVDDNDPDAYPSSVFFSWQKSSGSSPVVKYYDNLGRVLRSVKIGFNGTKIYSDIVYDNSNGSIAIKYHPYFKAEGQGGYTYFEYDELFRVKEKTVSGSGTTSYQYLGNISITINPLSQASTNIVNPLGWTVSNIDAMGNSVTIEYLSNGAVENRYIDGHPETNVHKEYDLLGNCTTMVDPALGTLKYEYNAYGQLISKYKLISGNPVYVVNELQYDLLGRVTKQIEPEGTTTWVYDTEDNGLGKLSSVSLVDGNGNLVSEKSYKYDGFGRMYEEKEIIKVAGILEEYITSNTFDILGRPKELTYPSGFVVKSKYNSNGYLGKVVQKSSNKVLWEAKIMNEKNQLEKFVLGNDLITERIFNSKYRIA